jgi:RimJ/RimL family protein N-acetyltransferase
LNPFLSNDRIILRALEPEDAPLLAACNNDPAVRLSFFTHTPTSIEAKRVQISSLYAPGADYLPLAICPRDEESPVGITALHRVDLVSGAAVFSICLTEATARGKGYGGEVTALMIEYAFDVLNLHRLQLHVWAGNAAGIRVYESCGFVREGVLREAMKHHGERCDFLVMGLLEPEWRQRNQRK